MIHEGQGADGLWDGTTGLYSSTAAAADAVDGGPPMGIVCADAADLGLSPGDSYYGVTIPSTGAIIARYTYVPDRDLDGQVGQGEGNGGSFPTLPDPTPAFVLVASGMIDTAHANGYIEPDGSFVYIPTDDFTGQDSFTYTGSNQATGSTSTATVTVSIQNVAPVVGITNVPGSEVPQNIPVTLGSSVVDPGIGDTFTYAWNVTKLSNGVTTQDFAAGTAANFTFTPDAAGTYTVQLVVTDAAGETGTTQAVIHDPLQETLYWFPQYGTNYGGGTPNPWTGNNNWNTSPSGGALSATSWSNWSTYNVDANFSSGFNLNVSIPSGSTVNPVSMEFNGNYTVSGGSIGLFSMTNVNVAWGDTATISSTIANSGGYSGGITKLSGGTLALSSTNSYTAGTAINGGVLEFSSGALGTTANISFGGGTLQWASGNTDDIGQRIAPISGGYSAYLDIASGQTVMLNVGGLSGGGSLTKLDSGTLVLTHNPYYWGGTTVSGGTLQLGDGVNSANNCNMGGMNIAQTATAVFAPVSSQTYVGCISGGGSVTLSGGAGSILNLSGGDTYTGPTTINSGTMRGRDGGLAQRHDPIACQ